MSYEKDPIDIEPDREIDTDLLHFPCKRCKHLIGRDEMTKKGCIYCEDV